MFYDWPAGQRFFIHSCIYLRIFIISYLATFLGTNSLSVLMCRKAINQSFLIAIAHTTRVPRTRNRGADVTDGTDIDWNPMEMFWSPSNTDLYRRLIRALPRNTFVPVAMMTMMMMMTMLAVWARAYDAGLRACVHAGSDTDSAGPCWCRKTRKRRRVVVGWLRIQWSNSNTCIEMREAIALYIRIRWLRSRDSCVSAYYVHLHGVAVVLTSGSCPIIATVAAAAVAMQSPAHRRATLAHLRSALVWQPCLSILPCGAGSGCIGQNSAF